MQKRQSIAGLDLLRLIAALMVMLYHFTFMSWVEPKGLGGIRDIINSSISFPSAPAYTSWGWIGVEIFFMISGFVIIKSAYHRTATAFFLNRIERIFPALVFFSFFVYLVVMLTGVTVPFAATVRFLKSIILFPIGPWNDGAIWTLTIEFAFYAVIFTVLITGRMADIFRGARVVLIVLTLGWILVWANMIVGLGAGGTALTHFFRSYPARLILLSTGPYFLTGMFAFEIDKFGLNGKRAMSFVLAVGVSMLSICSTALNTVGVTDFSQTPAAPLAAWALAVLALVAMLIIERRFLINEIYIKSCRSIGLMTYPVYLANQILGAFLLGLLYRAGLDKWIALLLAVSAVLVFSYLFALYIEPWLRRLIFTTVPAHLITLRIRKELT